jgi:RHS repeat-associated protein
LPTTGLGKVEEITDPAGRITELKYDTAGNLTQIIDPDASQRIFDYDAEHHMTGETDQRGHREQAFYDAFGRATRAVQKDGSVVQVNPALVQGLYRPEETASPNSNAVAFSGDPAVATYADGNGDVTNTTVDGGGQRVSTVDNSGPSSTVTRNGDNQISRVVSARGFTTEYDYDEQGNVVLVTDQVASPNAPSTLPSQSLSFDGIDDSVSFGDTIGDFGQNDFTIEFWMNTTTQATSTLLGKRENCGPGSFWEVDMTNGHITLEWRESSSNAHGLTSTFAINDGEWHHVAIARDGNTTSLFINGSLNNSHTHSSTLNFNNSASFIIGDLPCADSVFDSRTEYSGLIDEVKIWNHARTEAEIQAAKELSLSGTQTGLLGYWQFDEGVGTTVADLSGNGIDGVLQNGVAWVEQGAPLGVGVGSTETIFFDDFEGVQQSRWSSPRRAFTDDFTNFSGRFNLTEDGVDQTLTLATTPGEDYTLEFDLYAIDSLDGFGPHGPDYLEIFIDGENVFRKTVDQIGTPSESGSFGFSGWTDSIFRDVPINFTATSNATQIRFSDTFTGGFSDESWGIDNVEVVRNFVIEGSSEKTFTYDADFSQLLSSTDELGRQVLYDLDAEGNRVLMTQVVGELDSDQNGETDDVVTAYTYTDAGLIDTVTDGLGRITDYDYNPLGQIEQITFAMGSSDDEAQQTFEYDAAGNVSALIDENGHRTEYIYDDRNRVTQITEADPDGAGPLTSPVTQFTYDAAGNLETLTDARGHETRYTYDEKHRLIEVLDAEGNRSQYGYDQAGNMVSMVDGLGHETRYEYDSRNRRTAAIDAEGNRTEFRYDLDNNLAAIVDALGNETRFSYDARNRLISETDALDQVAIYEYDAANNLIAVTNRRDYTTRYSYDDLNRLTEVLDALNGTTHLGYDKVGNLTSTTDERNHTTTYGYDDRNRLEQITDARNGTVSYTYDGVGNQLSITDQLNRTTSFDYDALNRLTQITDPLTHSTGFGYNANGNLTTVTDALDRVTTYDYDRLNRQVSMVNALGDSSTTTYDAVGNVTAFTDELNRTTTFGYDDRNLLTQITDPLGHSTTRGYDAVGNLKTLTDALNHTTQYDYDDLYRRTQVIDPTNRETVMTYDEMGNLLSLTDAANNVTTYSYDELDRLATETITVDSTDLTRTYGYDAASNLTSLIDRNGREHSYDYDELNRQTQEHWLDDQANLLRTISFGYDAASQLTSASDPDSTYTYTYDLAGRLETVDNTGTPGVPAVVLTYGYDEVNNLTSVTDILNGTPAGTETFSYDDLNRVTQITQSGNGVADKRVNMTYDAASQLQELSRYSDLAGNQLVADTTYDYDLAGRLTDLTHGPAANPIADYGFSYDDANRLTQLVTPEGTSDYAYNDRDELTEADHTAQADETYDYDATGNRTDHTTGDHNRLQSDGTYEYEYDSEGNRTRRVEIATGEVTEYSWDHRNRLTAVITKDGGVITEQVDYTYDVYDRRITKTVDADGAGAGTATEEHFVYDGEHISRVFDETGTQTQRYLHGPQIDQVLAEETAAGDTHWALTDHQGSVRDVIDDGGAVLNHRVYDSFGQVTSESDPTVDFRFGYTGRELDAETELMYYRARYFDPAAGTFVSEDPLGFGAGDENLYRYVFNSPTNFTDPSGQAFVLVAPGLLVPIAIAVGVTTVAVAGYNIYTGLQSIDESRSGVSPEEFDPNYGARDRTVPDLGPIDIPHGFPLPGDNWNQWPHGIPQGPVCEVPDHGLTPLPRPDYSDLENNIFTSGNRNESSGSDSTEDILNDIREGIERGDYTIRPNPLNPKTAQEGNVTIDFGDGIGVNLRIETHPLTRTGEPVRHANVETIRRNRNGRNTVTDNKHIVE